MKQIISQTNIKRPFPATALLMLSLLVIMLAIGCTAGKKGTALTPPPDFQTLAEVDLSAHPFDGEIVGQFTLEETAVVSLFYTLPNIDIPYFDLSLIGPDDSSLTILHSENYRTDENGGGTWEQSLSPGTYRLALTSEPGPGTLSVYWGHP